MTRRAAFGVFVLLLALAAVDLEAQCAMCRTALTSSPEGRGLAPEFNRAILLMIAAPYLVFGTVGLVAFRGRVHSAWLRFVARHRSPGR